MNALRSNLSLAVAAGLCLSLAPLVACGGDKKDANAPQASASALPPPPVGGYPPNTAPNQGGYPPPQGGYPPPQGGYSPPQGGYPPPQGGYPPPQGTAPAPSASAAAPVAGLPGVPLDPALMQQIAAAGAALMGGAGAPMPAAPGADPVEAALKAAAAKDAPGMQPEGALTKDAFAADGHKGMMITLQGGKCYTIVAASAPGQVTNVDLHLLAPPFYNLEAGKDDGTGPVAVIGKGSQPLCPVVPMPVQYKLDVHAKAGQGTIGVQVFSKAK